MKKKLLVSLLVVICAIGNVMAESATVRKYLKLTDSEFNVSRWGSGNTVNGDVLYINGTTGDNAVYGNQAGWNFTTSLSTSEWNKLVIKLTNAGPAVLQARVTDGEYEASYDFAASENVATYEFDLSSLEGSKTVDNVTTTSTFSNITSFYFWGYWGGGNTVTIDEIYFEKTVESSTADDTKEIEITDPTETSYTISGGTNYKYLVIVPSAPYVENSSKEFIYSISDGTNTIKEWGFAYGFYQQRRESVLDLTNKKVWENSNESASSTSAVNTALTSSSIDLTKLTSVTINPSGDGTPAISAIYFTNEKPTYTNIWNTAHNTTNCDYVREATASGTYGTICLPYNAAICGAYAYEVVGVDNLDTPTKIYLKQVYGLLKAGVPYIYETNTDKSSDFQEGYVTFYKAGATTGVPTNDGPLVGSFDENMPVPEGCYGLASGAWKKSSGNAYLGQYKAYLDLSKCQETSGNTVYKSIAIGGNTTGIENIEVAAPQNDGAIYNMSGMRVVNPTKGIYIKNGKKFGVK